MAVDASCTRQVALDPGSSCRRSKGSSELHIGHVPERSNRATTCLFRPRAFTTNNTASPTKEFVWLGPKLWLGMWLAERGIYYAPRVGDVTSNIVGITCTCIISLLWAWALEQAC